jgi:hypothetical protein
MGWSEKSNPKLVEAIVACFCESPEHSRQNLSQFGCADWARTELWLDNSGLALYFLTRVYSAGIADVVDTCTLRRLEQKLAENRDRRDDMIQEFVAINHAFRKAGVRYANLKGFTLAPDSCPDLSLRRQSDFDFLIHPADLNISRALVEDRGYEIVCATARTLELRSGNAQKVSLEGRYKATPLRSVELHTALEPNSVTGAGIPYDKRLDRLTLWKCEKGHFPALSSADQLIGQALHLLGHLLSEHTRPSWFLEYRHHVLAKRGDTAFWTEVHALACGQKDAAIALGLSTLLARELFGTFEAPELDPWTLDVLPSEVRLWAERYGRHAVLADVPGTKLYLFLDSVLAASCKSQQPRNRAALLFPMHRPPRILRPPPKDTIRLRIQREIAQLHFVLYRTRFHLTQGTLYFIEACRWSRLVKKGFSSRSTDSGESKSRSYSNNRKTQDKDIVVTNASAPTANVKQYLKP